MKKQKKHEAVWFSTNDKPIVANDPVSFERTYIITEWNKKDLGTIEGKYTLVSLTQAGGLIYERWVLNI